MRALVNIQFNSRSAARPAIDLLESTGLACTDPVWNEDSTARRWLVQVQCPEHLSDGATPVDEALKVIRDVVHLHDGLLVADVAQVRVVPGRNYTTRPGGPPFMNGLHPDVIRTYDRSLVDGSGANGDVPLFANEPVKALE